jgi:DNA (cytosine-5)-methyltransferase 1
MTTPRLLDLFSGAGGAAMGYHRAGFEVVGVDIEPQPRYPFEFHQADALTYLLEGFDVIHASPPCQDHSATAVIAGRPHGTGWMLAAMRDRLRAAAVPYVLENVEGADMPGAAVLCGRMFGLMMYEHRQFETSFVIPVPWHPAHAWRTTKMGRPPKPDECMQVTGHFSDVDEARRRMGCEWMTRDELAQAIPPAYTRHVGLAALDNPASALVQAALW